MRCFPAATCPASARRCRPPASTLEPRTEGGRDDHHTDRRHRRSTSTPKASSTDPSQWNERDRRGDRARERRRRLTDRHWLVVRFMRDQYLDTGTLRRSARSARSPASRSRSSTSSSRRAPRSSPPRSAASPSPGLHLGGRMTDTVTRPRASRRRSRRFDHRLEGLARGHLPRTDHGQRRAHGGDRGEHLLHVLRSRRDPQDRHGHIKVATVGNPGLHLATCSAASPAVRARDHRCATADGELDIPPIPEFMELIADSGAGLYACKASVDMFGLDDGRLHPAGATDHHRRRVLREGRRRRDHLHLRRRKIGCSSGAPRAHLSRCAIHEA